MWRQRRARLSGRGRCPKAVGSFRANPWTKRRRDPPTEDRKSTRLNSSHRTISYAVFCVKKKKDQRVPLPEPKDRGTVHVALRCPRVDELNREGVARDGPGESPRPLARPAVGDELAAGSR